MTLSRHTVILIASLLLAGGMAASLPIAAQEPPAPASSQPAPPVYTEQQLDQMLAPIALYPDPLLAQILMASTYPLEIVEAQRWRQQPANMALTSETLPSALAAQPWDPSVKSLVAFPQVLSMLDGNLQWTETLGDAFLAGQQPVVDAVQRLRQRAQTAGTLQSTPQDTVTTQGSDILIDPANPQMLYVPYYNPATVYGSWPYPDYPPVYFAAPPDLTYATPYFGYGVGFGIIAPLWGWENWDWQHHRIHIDDDRYRALNGNRAPSVSDTWQHDPAHRHGVPYRDAQTRAGFSGASAPSAEQARSYRGYSSAATLEGRMTSHGITITSTPAAAPSQVAVERAHPIDRTPMMVVTPQQQAPRPQERAPEVIRMEPVGREEAPRAVAPAFESFARGPDARMQATRGMESSSFTVAHAPQAATHSPPQHAEGGGHGEPRH